MEATFSIIGEDVEESLKGVNIFKYLGRPLDWLENYWLSVLMNIRKA